MCASATKFLLKIYINIPLPLYYSYNLVKNLSVETDCTTIGLELSNITQIT